MPKQLIPIPKLDHPEQFDDLIREYDSPERKYPTPLMNLLFEVAGHRCAICQAPWLEIHHIEELSHGGRTTLDNLIVLCPNCHTRHHKTGEPTAAELRHYKLKQEIAYELPVYSRLSEHDVYVVKHFASMKDEDIPAKELKSEFPTTIEDHEEARAECRKTVAGYLHETGIIQLDIGHVGIGPGPCHLVYFRIRLTSKGIKWIRFLRDSDKLSVLGMRHDDTVAVAVTTP